MHDGTFPALLKLLSEQSISEDVIKADLHLITQISSASEDEYFTSFIRSLLNLFRSDTALLEKRGSLIVRQLCNNLRTERIYRDSRARRRARVCQRDGPESQSVH